MLTAFIQYGDGSVSTDPSPEAITRGLHDHKARFWLDMNKPTDEELGYLDEVFGFHPLAIEDAIKYSQRPKIEAYKHTGEGCTEGYFYMVIHGPDLATFREKLRTKELDIFVSERYVLTIRDEEMVSINAVIEIARGDPARLLQAGIDRLLHTILDRMVDAYEPIFDFLGESIDALEEQAVQDPDPSMLPMISQRKRELLTLRRVIGPQREVIAQLTRGEVPFIQEATRIYFRDVLDHLNRAVETIELYRDLVIGARDIYMSSVSNNLNKVMKTLTIISVLALPINLVTGFFGMNFPNFPGISSHYAFWIAVGTMLVASIISLLVFRRLRWL